MTTILRRFISNRNERNRCIPEYVYLCLSILEISKVVMFEFWYDYKAEIWGKSKIILHGYR